MSRGGHSYYSRANRETTVPGGSGCSDREGTTLQQRRQHFKSLLPLFCVPLFLRPRNQKMGRSQLIPQVSKREIEAEQRGARLHARTIFLRRAFLQAAPQRRCSSALPIGEESVCYPKRADKKKKKNERAESRLQPSSKPNRFAKRQAQRTCVFFPSELAKRTESKNRSRNRR